MHAGDGVIGKFPILTPGGPEFVYQSCTTVPEAHGERGFMDGSFRCNWEAVLWGDRMLLSTMANMQQT